MFTSIHVQLRINVNVAKVLCCNSITNQLGDLLKRFPA
jgi:hypothetical protein